MANKDYYKILGVEKGADKETIKKAYKNLAKKYHPDISKEANAQEKFKEINEAAGVLLDDEKRKRYETYGSADGPQGFGGGGYSGGAQGFNPRDFGVNLDDIFEQFGFGFGGFNGGGFSQSSQRSRAPTRVAVDVEITLFEAFTGIEKDISISRDVECDDCEGSGAQSNSSVDQCSTCGGKGYVFETQQSLLGMIRTQRPCSKCHGTGEIIKNPCLTCHGKGSVKKKDTLSVKIPKGVQDGMTLRVSGKGNFNKDDGAGDLYVRVTVLPQDKYEIDEENLYLNVSVNFIQAILGDDIEFEHFGKTLIVKIPQGTQPGTILRLKDKGLPIINSHEQGDLYVKLSVEIPRKVTVEQKKILEQYTKTEKTNFFGKFTRFFK